MTEFTNLSAETAASVTSDVQYGPWMNRTLTEIQTYLSSIFDEKSQCQKFAPINHAYFQLANIFFLLSYFAPNGKCGIIYLRLMLLIGCVFFAVWGLEILCTLDVLIWNITFIICNIVHIVILLLQIWPMKFSKEIEDLYIEVFRPLKVSRKQFKTLLRCLKSVKSLKYQEIYAQENVTRVEFLSVVLSGKLVISQQSRALQMIFPHQFLDSSEWFSMSTNDFFQVTITAVEDSRILVWHRDKLKLSIIRDKFLQTILDHILSKDVVTKFIQVNDVVSAPINGHLSSTCDEDAFCDNKSLMIVKRSGDGNGITALLNRQLQGAKTNELLPLLNRGSSCQNNEQMSKLVLHTK